MQRIDSCLAAEVGIKSAMTDKSRAYIDVAVK